MISTVRDALRLVDAWTRRKVLLSVAVALGLAALEIVAFGTLYALLAATAPGDKASGGFVLRALHLEDVSTGTIAAVSVVLLLTKSVTAALAARWQATVATQTEARLSKRIFAEYMQRPLLFHVARNSSYSVSVLTAQIGTLANSVISGVITLIVEACVLSSIFAALIAVNPALALSIAAYISLVGVVYVRVLSHYVSSVSLRFYELQQELFQALQEGFSGIKAIQAFAVADEVSARYAEVRDEYAVVSAKMAFAQRLPQFYLEVCTVLGITTAGIVVSQVGHASDPYAVVGLLVVAALRVLPSGNRVLGAISGIRMGEAAVVPLRDERIEFEASAEARLARSARVDLPASGALPTMSAEFRLEGVSFTYPGAHSPALDGIDLSFARGEWVGIVGRSGSGKTTLVDVLLGLLTPDSGVLTVDGVAVDSRTMSDWRRQVAYVPQESYLMDASIAENVAFYRTGALGEAPAIWQALDDAMLGPFVRELPDALDTTVGERGARLSGGQRQRLGIARALLTRPEILLLDEATSALDGSTEAAITDTLENLSGRVTVVTIAHRLSTVRGCDRLILMEAGKVVAEGTFEELIALSPTFSEMASQAGF